MGGTGRGGGRNTLNVQIGRCRLRVIDTVRRKTKKTTEAGGHEEGSRGWGGLVIVAAVNADPCASAEGTSIVAQRVGARAALPNIEAAKRFRAVTPHRLRLRTSGVIFT